MEICHRLDGSPLGIELAAAQVKGLGVEEIAMRLDERFRLLRVGSRNMPERHQTLRASIDWSYDLLVAEHRRLLRYLSIFAGGWTMEAAESVCAHEGYPREEVPEGMLRLVDKSLVVPTPNSNIRGPLWGMRYGMHETIREYAREKLEEAREAGDLRARHLQYFTALAEAAEPQLRGPDQLQWLEQLDAEHDNIRAALDRALNGMGNEEFGLRNNDEPIKDDQSNIPNSTLHIPHSVEQALRLSGALWRFWLTRGYLAEGLRRLEAALRGIADYDEPNHDDQINHLTRNPQSAIRNTYAKALGGAGVLAHGSGNYPASLSYLEQNLAVRRALGDRQAIASALQNLGAVTKFQDLTRARTLIEESLALKRELGDKRGTANSLATLGAITCEQGDYAAARSLYDEAMALHRETGDLQGLATGLNNLGSLLLDTGDHSGARTLYQESLSIARKVGDKSGLAAALGNLGRVAADQGDYAGALSLQKESLEEYRRAGFLKDVCENLHDMAMILGASMQGQEAVRLLGAAEAARLATDYRLTPVEQARNDRGIARLRSQIRMEPHVWEAAYAQGLAMSMEQAIEYATQVAPAVGAA